MQYNTCIKATFAAIIATISILITGFVVLEVDIHGNSWQVANKEGNDYTIIEVSKSSSDHIPKLVFICELRENDSDLYAGMYSPINAFPHGISGQTKEVTITYGKDKEEINSAGRITDPSTMIIGGIDAHKLTYNAIHRESVDIAMNGYDDIEGFPLNNGEEKLRNLLEVCR